MKILLLWQSLMLLFNAVKLAVKLTSNDKDDLVVDIVERLIKVAKKVKNGDYNVGVECTEIIALAKLLRKREEE